MSLKLKHEDFDKVLAKLGEEYSIYAPRQFKDCGRFSDTDLIRYGEISSIDDMVWDEKSSFSPKEIVFPITQSIFRFSEDEYREPSIDDKKIIIFLRACDINGIRRLDTIFLKNGDDEDFYYKRLREKVKFVLVECRSSFDNCFCVSMNSNTTDDYSIAVRFEDNDVLLDIQDDELDKYFSGIGKEFDFSPEFVSENAIKVIVSEVKEMPEAIFTHAMWDEYKSRCIACGRCNTTCITCSCFSTDDIFYDESTDVGERRRTWAACHIDHFSDMAGGHEFRKDNAARMRFKALHKVYDYNKRFGEQMCVGCGRCDDNCPEYISFSSCINKLNDII